MPSLFRRDRQRPAVEEQEREDQEPQANQRRGPVTLSEIDLRVGEWHMQNGFSDEAGVQASIRAYTTGDQQDTPTSRTLDAQGLVRARERARPNAGGSHRRGPPVITVSAHGTAWRTSNRERLEPSNSLWTSLARRSSTSGQNSWPASTEPRITPIDAARYLAALRRRRSDVDITRIVDGVENDPFIPSPMADEIAASLPRITIEQLDEQHIEPDCAVCLESQKSGEVLIQLPCKHAYHESCIFGWFRQRDTCPKCRARVTGDKSGALDGPWGDNDDEHHGGRAVRESTAE